MKQVRQTSNTLTDLNGYVVVTSSLYPCPGPKCHADSK